jgi:hypothetical protein
MRHCGNRAFCRIESPRDFQADELKGASLSAASTSAGDTPVAVGVAEVGAHIAEDVGYLLIAHYLADRGHSFLSLQHGSSARIQQIPGPLANIHQIPGSFESRIPLDRLGQ